MNALERFARIMAHTPVDLARACFEIATDHNPTLDIDAAIARLEAIAAVVRARLAPDAFAEQKLAVLTHHLFDELGFRGNADDYFDPRNSYLDVVLERRLGIPITLAVICIEVGRRVGLQIDGVAFPGHFLMKVRVARGYLVLDPFERAAPQSEQVLRQRLERALPQAAFAAELATYLESASPGTIVARVLRNLKATHLERGNYEQALAVLHRLVIAAPDAVAEVRDRGLAFEQLEAFRAALADLEAYLRRSPDARDAPEIRARVVDLRAKCARLN